ncbi:hypothetical protein TGDOM2_233530 [Toxoplasma gondii GAB2-2007-GAL-DOM2]|uniref:Uncharacterized protein n=5 Tax=Toxoplasma gondii TaxID=5811 RepID=S7WBY1_TOXGG|nr:hypothetical protein TGGT1_233530 [Toxoplasma gondii GT1]KAF4641940.1 hypothetical protein TGRH88_077520 [Toxoplasma gondii]KFG48900.1 hypothetical protein TGDOM2_233530 [Toxoplasma gondii GAB2-2007-GAL-DOM2]KFG55179.1 hypothetical protein TGFOU_233530 [Toxoplasma gondii FOU]PUA92527.1 hypothetical protein TGBR9_233530 [Toxoplasma gondii TgCATBr9]
MAASPGSPAVSAALVQFGRGLQHAISNASSAIVAAAGHRSGTVTSSVVQSSAVSETSCAALLSPLLGLGVQSSPPSADKGSSTPIPDDRRAPDSSSHIQPVAPSHAHQSWPDSASTAREEGAPAVDTAPHTEEPGSEPGQAEDPASRSANNVSSLKRPPPSVREGDNVPRITRREDDASSSPPDRSIFVGPHEVPTVSGGGAGGRNTVGNRLSRCAPSYFPSQPGTTFQQRVGASTACCSLLSSPCAPSLCSSVPFPQQIPQLQVCRTEFDRMGFAGAESRLEEVENSWFFIDIFGGDNAFGKGTRGTQFGTSSYPVDETSNSFAECITPASVRDRRRYSFDRVLKVSSPTVEEEEINEMTRKGLKTDSHQALSTSAGGGDTLPTDGREGVTIPETRASRRCGDTVDGREESLVDIESRSSGLVRINEPSEIGLDASQLASTLTSELIYGSRASSFAADEGMVEAGTLSVARSVSRSKLSEGNIEANGGIEEPGGGNEEMERDLSAGTECRSSIPCSLRRLFETQIETQKDVYRVVSPIEKTWNRDPTYTNTQREKIRFLDRFLTPLSPEEKLHLATRSAAACDVRDGEKSQDDAFPGTEPVMRSRFPSTFFPALTARSFWPQRRYTTTTMCPENLLGGETAGYWRNNGTADLTSTSRNGERSARRSPPGRHRRCGTSGRHRMQKAGASTSFPSFAAMVAFLQNSIDLYGPTALEGVTFHVPAEDAEDFLAALEESLPYSWHDFESAVVEALKPLTALVVGRLVFVQLPSFLFEFLATTESTAAAATATAEATGVTVAGILPSLCSFASCLIVFGGCVYALVRGAKALHSSRRAQLLMSMKTEDASESQDGRNHDDHVERETYVWAERAERGEAGVDEGREACEQVTETSNKRGREEVHGERDVYLEITKRLGEDGNGNERTDGDVDTDARRATGGKHQQTESARQTTSVVVIRRDPERKWKDEDAVREGVSFGEWRACFPP